MNVYESSLSYSQKKMAMLNIITIQNDCFYFNTF